ncbi:MAG: hypothetical protein ACK4YP_08600 [Myxococcota bacterium]
MIRPLAAALLAVPLLAGCSSVNDLCGTFLGNYTGTFDGDASGTLDIAIQLDDSDDSAVVELTLEGDEFSAVGNGTVACEDGELVVTLFDDAGNEIGTFTGSMIDEAGEWSLGTGESGTWDIAAASAE